MDKQTAANYLRDSFSPADRIAIVLIPRRTQDAVPRVEQRLLTVDKAAGDRFQSWLRFANMEGKDVYYSVNTIHPEAFGRLKSDIAEVRHVYLDFDVNGKAAIDALRARNDMPTPNVLVNTSPDKYQAIWRVEQFSKQESEHLMQRMAPVLGADIAVHDCARVLRLPGFYNHKVTLEKQHFVTIERIEDRVYRPQDFPQFPEPASRTIDDRTRLSSPRIPGQIDSSQSGRDWAYVMRKLDEGMNPEQIIQKVARYRSGPNAPGNSKVDPWKYAADTVSRAQQQRVQVLPTRSFTAPSR